MKRFLIGVAVAGLLVACSAETIDSGDVRNKSTNDSSTIQHSTQIDLQPSVLLAGSLPEISAALQSGEVSAEDLVSHYLERIEAIDRSGPTLQSVLTINPDALAQARELDAKRAAGEALRALHGVPILLKDNIESKDNMATTAGALALKDNITGRDSPLVAGLRAQGAIILGKSNLSQWANFRSNDSMSGWSALGGQVRNPHMLDRNPCGSSSGSGVAVAASLTAGAVGTETNGSIICPSTVNGVVGFKPTVGLVAQDLIIPISSTQDTAGPMTKTVRGAAMMLNAMATGEGKTDYVAGLSADSLDGKRVGVLRFAEGSNADVIAAFNRAVSELERAGATLIEIAEFDRPGDFNRASRAVLDYEFKATLNAYLANAAPAVTTRSLEQLIAFNTAHSDVELALFDQSIFDGAQEKGPLTDPEYTEALNMVLLKTRDNGINALMSEHDLDVMVSPSGPVPGRIDPINGDVWPSWAGAGWMAAIGGTPHLSVPMGNVHGMPIGLSFIGAAGQDAEVLNFGYAYEQRTNHLLTPQYLKDAEGRAEIAGPMKRQ